MRRFLEQYSESINCVIFVLEPSDLGIYNILLPLYFPRNLAEEENACWQLPSDIGGMDGEPQFPDRQIRIIDNPQHALHGIYSDAFILSTPTRNEANTLKVDELICCRGWDRWSHYSFRDIGKPRRARLYSNARWSRSSAAPGRTTNCRSSGWHNAQGDAA